MADVTRGTDTVVKGAVLPWQHGHVGAVGQVEGGLSHVMG